jgi:glutathione peroxidase
MTPRQIACVLGAAAAVLAAAGSPGAEDKTQRQEDSAVTTNVYGFKAADIDGREVSLGDYKGKVLLVVNVASRCGFTSQYAGLQALYERYKDRGLVVMGFPANDFLGQEPGSNEEIKTFCSTKFNVTFPMFAKIEVKGDAMHPLYAWLTDEKIHPKTGGKISWNFNKFLLGRDGNVIERFGSRTTPDDKALVTAVEGALTPP